MKYIIQPNAWSCLPTAFAVASEIPFDLLIKKIGHDGGVDTFFDAKFPFNKRAFHIQEIIDALYDFNITVTEIECCPRLCGCKKIITIFDVDKIKERWHKYSKLHNLVLINNEHAVAFMKETQKIHDPAYTLENFPFHAYFIVRRGT